jgi:hypothetical protein
MMAARLDFPADEAPTAANSDPVSSHSTAKQQGQESRKSLLHQCAKDDQRKAHDDNIGNKRQHSEAGQPVSAATGAVAAETGMQNGGGPQKKRKKKGQQFNTLWRDIIGCVKEKDATKAWNIYNTDPNKKHYNASQLHTLGSLFLGKGPVRRL